MKEVKVVKRSNMPIRFPLWQTVTCLLALEHWNAPEWLYGVMGLFFILIWVAGILTFFKEKEIDLFENKKN